MNNSLNENAAKGYNHLNPNEHQGLSVSDLEKKMNEMLNSFEAKFAKLTNKISIEVLRSNDRVLKKLDEMNETNSFLNPLSEQDVEKEVVAESASFAKQLIVQLEQSSLMYVKQRQTMATLQQKLLDTEQQLKTEKLKTEELKDKYKGMRQDFEQKIKETFAEKTKELKKQVEYDTKRNLLYSFLSTVDNVDELLKPGANESFKQFLLDNGINVHKKYRFNSVIDVKEDCLKEHSQFVDGIEETGEYKVVASTFLIDEDLFYKGKMIRSSKPNTDLGNQQSFEPFDHSSKHSDLQ